MHKFQYVPELEVLRNFKNQEAKGGVGRESRAERHQEGARQSPCPAAGSPKPSLWCPGINLPGRIGILAEHFIILGLTIVSQSVTFDRIKEEARCQQHHLVPEAEAGWQEWQRAASVALQLTATFLGTQ